MKRAPGDCGLRWALATSPAVWDMRGARERRKTCTAGRASGARGEERRASCGDRDQPRQSGFQAGARLALSEVHAAAATTAAPRCSPLTALWPQGYKHARWAALGHPLLFYFLRAPLPSLSGDPHWSKRHIHFHQYRLVHHAFQYSCHCRRHDWQRQCCPGPRGAGVFGSWAVPFSSSSRGARASLPRDRRLFCQAHRFLDGGRTSTEILRSQCGIWRAGVSEAVGGDKSCQTGLTLRSCSVGSSTDIYYDLGAATSTIRFKERSGQCIGVGK